jgi:hypothetical protein
VLEVTLNRCPTTTKLPSESTCKRCLSSRSLVAVLEDVGNDGVGIAARVGKLAGKSGMENRGNRGACGLLRAREAAHIEMRWRRW